MEFHPFLARLPSLKSAELCLISYSQGFELLKMSEVLLLFLSKFIDSFAGSEFSAPQ
jgi:hypothetical protein